MHLDRGDLAEAGHEHHLRAINRIRPPRHPPGGRQRAADRAASCTSACSNNVDFLLAGSIRDDGPLPEVITDVLRSPAADAREDRGVTFCLMIATTLHSIAVGNLLPAWVKVVCVDINPSTVIKLATAARFRRWAW